jgi:predicted nucleic acid-binding protein
MNSIVFDTDVLIDLLRGNQKSYDQIKELVVRRPLFCSVITIAELYAGMFPHEKEATDNLIDSLGHVEVNSDIARRAGGFRFEYKVSQLDDCLIAATAFHVGASLFTKNVKHYPMKEIEVVQIV